LICGIGEELVVELGLYFILSRRDLQNVKSKDYRRRWGVLISSLASRLVKCNI
jgi:hypothetical protein